MVFSLLVGLVILSFTAFFSLPGLPFVWVTQKLMDSCKKEQFRFAGSLMGYLGVSAVDRTFAIISIGSFLLALYSTIGFFFLANTMTHGHWILIASVCRNALLTSIQQWAFTAKHVECHRGKTRSTRTYRLCQWPWLGICLERVNEWGTGLMYGNIPGTDMLGHGYLHHQNDSSTDDWGCVEIDRSCFLSFCRFVSKRGLWHNSGLGILSSLMKAKLWRLSGKIFLWMSVYYGAGALLYRLSPTLFLHLWLVPFLSNIGLASIINFSWHIFVDPLQPGNFKSSTITLLSWPGDLFNEGFHLSHHLHPNTHYSSLKTIFEKEEKDLRSQGCVILTHGDPIEIWALAMCRQFEVLARRLEDSSKGYISAWSHLKTIEERAGFVKARLQPAVVKPLTSV
jgi:hypothetical protein